MFRNNVVSKFFISECQYVIIAAGIVFVQPISLQASRTAFVLPIVLQASRCHRQISVLGKGQIMRKQGAIGFL